MQQYFQTNLLAVTNTVRLLQRATQTSIKNEILLFAALYVSFGKSPEHDVFKL